MKRIAFDISVIVALIVAPFWLTAVLLTLGIALVPRWWEAIAFALVIETVFGGGTEVGAFSGVLLSIPSMALAGIAVSALARTRLRTV
jgi:hypothetical protein